MSTIATSANHPFLRISYVVYFGSIVVALVISPTSAAFALTPVAVFLGWVQISGL